MSLLIKNAKIQEKNKTLIKNVLCRNGKIYSITNSFPKSDKTIDAKGKLLLSGGIDVHVHFREPGMKYKAEWKTESKAAAAGGITTVFDMPNTLPPTFTVKELNKKKNIAEKNSLVNFGFHFGTEKLNEIKKAKINSVKIFMGKSTGNLVTENKKIKEIFKLAKQKNLVCVLHAEDEKIIEENIKKAKEKKWNNVKFHNKIRNEKAEIKAIKNALSLQKKIGNKIHFAHVSTAKGLKEIIKSKKTGKGKITCEVCPHHLFLNEKDLKRLGNFGKMNPPLRTKKDNEFLWKSLIQGKVDIVSTDHAPHLKKEKQKKFFDAPSGVTGVETVYPLLLNKVAEKKIKLEKVIEVLCENPARIFGIKNKGKIKKGFDADLVLVDLNKKWTIRNKEMHSKCKWTPFNGKKISGKIETTIIGGKIVFNKTKFHNKFKGKKIILTK